MNKIKQAILFLFTNKYEIIKKDTARNIIQLLTERKIKVKINNIRNSPMYDSTYTSCDCINGYVMIDCSIGKDMVKCDKCN